MAQRSIDRDPRCAIRLELTLLQYPGLKQRHFVVAEAEWTVCEDPDVAALGNERALIFLGPGVARRVRHYPGNWQSLTDDDLYRLSWGS